MPSKTPSAMEETTMRKKLRLDTGPRSPENGKLRSDSAEDSGHLDRLPDDLVVSILCKLCSSVRSRSDLINVLFTCKRLKCLGLHPLVLEKASPRCYMVGAHEWSESAHLFIKLCADSGNMEASYILGMIRFYCLHDRASGVALMAKAAMGSYAPALYSLAVIQFNGSGGFKNSKDLRAGVALCARAAAFGHVKALRELGHCLQDGYGVGQNLTKGRCMLAHAKAHELRQQRLEAEMDPVSRFMVEWFKRRWAEGELKGLRMCSRERCGRPETRPNEFRGCAACVRTPYCSRACQVLHWRLRHRNECSQS